MIRRSWAPFEKGAGLYGFVIFVVALGALATRVPRLPIRPMHTDEAVHADKFRDLLEAGKYEYDPHEYHGPTLNYLTLIPAWLRGQQEYAEITEATLRIVPVVFSVALIGLTGFLAGGLGPAVMAAALFTAVSPAMFFYSRYYIQEMLLICFTFGAIVSGYRYMRTKALVWMVAAGVSLGLMHATKETCIIAFGGMGLAAGLLVLVHIVRERSWRAGFAGVRCGHVVVGLVAAVGISALFYSSFFTRSQGIWDSYLTYATYLARGGGHDTTHVHPWHYYLQMLAFARYEGGPVWSEGATLLLAVVGLIVAVRGKPVCGMDPTLLRFIAIYTVALTVVYSAIPYKTPWCLLGFLHGMILLAGAGAVALLSWMRRPATRMAVAALLVVAAGHLAFQSYRGSFTCHADSRNPYVYAHTTEDIFAVADAIREYAGVGGLGESVPIQVACSGKDYWPLPWYLRSYAVAWSVELPPKIGPLIVISDDLEGALARRLYVETPAEDRRMYMYLFDDPYYMWLRPQVKLLGFVRKDVWELLQQRPDPTELLKDMHDRQAGQPAEVVRPQ
ncbi:flippase activity-associated protein Agl23 [Anaerobaca lacustris]|uniref:TIGR03663 family protein n=1 Tax=Anaerobaca lacustris TaxID=3044600 RepID=A0AAW6TW65_9BACT|nr:TIGR03663 family protein [Sedimentisphaerales bacterium M17dextr]